MVEGGGFEPPKSTTTDLQSVPFGRSGIPPGMMLHFHLTGAGDGTRTRNLLITSQLLYQLSYASNSRQSVEFVLLLQWPKIVKFFFGYFYDHNVIAYMIQHLKPLAMQTEDSGVHLKRP